MRKKLIYVIAVAALVTLYFALGIGTYPPIIGTVVDAETGRPIDGAVVLVEWTKTHGIGEHHTESYKVEETVTDKDGKFAIRGLDKRGVDAPSLTIYKKGYVAWSSRWIFPDRRNRTDFKWGNNVFKLDHYKKEYSYTDHVMFISLSISESMNSESKSAIQKAFNWETKMAYAERAQKKP